MVNPLYPKELLYLGEFPWENWWPQYNETELEPVLAAEVPKPMRLPRWSSPHARTHTHTHADTHTHTHAYTHTHACPGSRPCDGCATGTPQTGRPTRRSPCTGSTWTPRRTGEKGWSGTSGAWQYRHHSTSLSYSLSLSLSYSLSLLLILTTTITL